MAVAISITGCMQQRVNVPALVPAWGAVLDSVEGAKSLQQPTRETPQLTGYWTPSTDDLRRLESGLAIVLDSVFRRLPIREDEKRPRIDEFVRQYAGFVLEGRRLVYVSAETMGIVQAVARNGQMSSEQLMRKAWRASYGGTGLFGIVYEPATRRFGRIEFNSDGGPRVETGRAVPLIPALR